jgi:hypothetical protein
MLSYCELDFGDAKLRNKHQIKCKDCIRVMDAYEEAMSPDDSIRESGDCQNDTGESGTDSDDAADRGSTLFLSNPRQRELLATLLTSYDASEHIVISPDFQECVLRPGFSTFHAGWVRKDNRTVADAWLVIVNQRTACVTFKSRMKICTNFTDTKFLDEDAEVPLMPVEALSVLLHVFEDRYRSVVRELRRINAQRKAK